MSQQKDSDKAAELFSAALSEISASSIAAVLDYFSKLDAGALIKNPDKYFEEWLELLDEYRRAAWELGQAYYRLDAAIWTGTAPDNGTGEVSPLSGLWKTFLKLVGVSRFRSSLPESEIDLDDPAWPGYDMNYFRRNAAATYYTRAIRRLKQFESRNRRFMEADEYLNELEKLMRTISVDMSRESQRLSQNGGRDAVLQGVQKSKHRVGYMRVPTGSFTCGFCIMLASRGAVYPTKASAGFQGVGREYHAGCDCLIRPLWEGQEEPKPVMEAKASWKKFSDQGGGNASAFVKWYRKGD